VLDTRIYILSKKKARRKSSVEGELYRRTIHRLLSADFEVKKKVGEKVDQ